MNEKMIRQWYDVFKDNHELTEIRVLEGRKTYSGYFTNIESLLKAIRPYDNLNIFFSLNKINESCYDREQRDIMVMSPKSTTSDNDIIGIDWLMVDIDVEKPSDTNSTDEEKEAAKPVVNKVYKYLKDEGFYEPVICDSGNGFHLNYRVAMKNSPENTRLRKDFLLSLSMLFSTETVKIDCSTFNASRICKCYGVMSRKGSARSKTRPQRESAILRVPKDIRINSNAYIKKIADLVPEPEKPDRNNGFNTEHFDIDAFISKYGIRIRNITDFSGGRKYVLEECPFNPSHKAPDSAIFAMSNGAIAFKCLHNSDSDKGWREFRSFYEPDAYDRKYQSYRYRPIFNRDVQRVIVPQGMEKGKGKIWERLGDVEKPKFDINDFIPTGIIGLDSKGMGLKRKHITVLSGHKASGKTSLMNMIVLNAVNNKYKVAMWSGEMTSGEIKQWLYLQAAGKSYVQRVGNTEYYNTSPYIDEKISFWLDKYFLLYNNEYSQDAMQICAEIERKFNEESFDLVVLDNLMCFDGENIQGDSNEKDKQKIMLLVNLAKRLNIHIIFVAHPNKSTGLLRDKNISGSGAITNYAQNVFLWHRVKYRDDMYIRDFERDYEEFFGHGSFNSIKDYSNVLEIAKFRAKGSLMGTTYGMYYEKETGRFLNSPYEHTKYGWMNDNAYEEDMYAFDDTSTEIDCPF